MQNLHSFDPEISLSINSELKRQQEHIELIASENIVSKAVLEAAGSVLTNKYAEGYPDKRYYNGCEYVDDVEKLAQERLKKLFNCQYVNVQPHSGSQANQAVFLALLQPHDSILGMSLDSGGHLTHGASKNLSGLWFNVSSYGTDSNGLINYDEVRRIALEKKPKLIIAGFSAYPRIVDWKKFREIADEVGAYLMADIAHVAGLVAKGYYPSPIEYAHVVTSTTHKTLRGPRGGIVMSNDLEIGKKINSALFPGLQGGPLMHIIAAKAVAFKEALDDSFGDYIKQVVLNSKALAERLMQHDIDIISGGTDNHIVLINLARYNISGKFIANKLEECGLICNKNGIPNDPLPPTITSGIRLGSPACTSRGFKEKEFIQIADWINEVVKNAHDEEKLNIIIQKIKKETKEMCSQYPIY